MKISKLNYEAFFLDYWEGNLNDSQKKQLSGFLEEYPELQNDFLDYKEAFALELTPETPTVFEGRERLKKSVIRSVDAINEQNYEHWIVAHLEGELVKKQEKIFNEFLSLNRHLKPEIELYRRTFLQPDYQVIYDDKAELKKENVLPYRKPLVAILSIAAAVLLFITFFVAPFDNFFSKDELAKSVPLPPERIMPIYSQSIHINKDSRISSAAAIPEAATIVKSVKPDALPTVNYSAASTEAQQVNGSDDESIPGRPEIPVHPLASIHTAQILPAAEAYADATPPMKNNENISDLSSLFVETNNRGFLKRIAENLGQRIFGQKEVVNEQGSLLTEVANKSIETFNDFKNITFARASDGSQMQSEAVLALSDRLAIRIKRGNRQLENSY